MGAHSTNLEKLDHIARAQLALIHAAVRRPFVSWEMVEQLILVWRSSNAERYLYSGVAPKDIPASLRMAFRDYLADLRREDPEEAECFRAALGPELETLVNEPPAP